MPEGFLLEAHTQFRAQAPEDFGKGEVVLFFDPGAQGFQVGFESGDPASAAWQFGAVSGFAKAFPVAFGGALAHVEAFGSLGGAGTLAPRGKDAFPQVLTVSFHPPLLLHFLKNATK